MGLRRTIDRPQAEEIAVKAFGFLAQDQERLARFLALTGLGPDTIRTAAASPGFFGAVLDYVAGDESLLTALASELGETPETMMRARDILAPRETGN
jgi:hypothetical protein